MIKLKIFILSILLASVAIAKTEVELKSVVEAGTSLNLQLEDLIVLKNQSVDVVRTMIDMDLPFKDDVISNENILVWLKSAIKERPELRNISFKIPQEIEIKRIAGLAKSQIKQRIQNRLSLKCNECLFQIQISNVPEIKAKSVNLDWKEIPLSGAFMFSVTSNEGQNLSWISGQIKTQREVVKATKVLKSGDTVVDSDIKLEAADITYSKDYYLKKSDVLGKKTSRVITMGSLLTSSDIQREYDVKQGQTVKTITGNESFEITLQTVAQESGVAGDSIRVRNLVNQKIMSARIIEKGIVRIE